MKLSPKTLTGILNVQNKDACDWGWQGMLAYGCQNLVTVIEIKTVQVIQTLERHKSQVVRVKWARENYHHDLMSPYTLRLASADAGGKIVVWDVAQAGVKSEFSEGQKPVSDLEWLSTQDASHDLLAALHPPATLVLWNADTGTKLWKKPYSDTLLSFSFDPFDPSHVAFLGQDCIVFVEDFTASKLPSSQGKKFYISSPGNGNQGSGSSASNLDKKSKNTLKRMTSMLVGEQGKQRSQDEESIALNECIQLAFHQSCRHHILLVYSREVLILDLEINQTVGIISLDRTGSPFSRVLPCRQRDVIMALHENGGISVRIRRRGTTSQSPDRATGSVSDEPNQTPMDVVYDLRAQSDPLRVTKNNRVFAVACCPITEKTVALVMSDSKVLFWDLKTVDVNHSETIVLEGQPSAQKHGIFLKFVLTGMLNGVAAPPHVLRMCPPLTTKNWNIYQPLLAVGTTSGIIQVFNLSSGQLWREYSIHTCQVRGIEWVSLSSFLSFAYPNAGSSGLVKNELVQVDMHTGKITQFRTNRDEESPMEMIKISHLKQYFVIVFKDKPFELWDLNTGLLLREMPKNFPHITALEWSPAHNLKSLRKKMMNQEQSLGSSTSMQDLSTSASTGSLDPIGRSDTKSTGSGVCAREHFVFTDSDGLLYHFIVEGNMIKDGSKVPPDGGMGSITCIAWKGELMVLGDVDGNLNIWDLKSRVSRAVPTHRGWIRKVKFAPGRGNQKLLVLYNDGIGIWDAKDLELVSSIKSPKEVARIHDADWAASDKPVFSSADGCIRVIDIKLKVASSPHEEYTIPDPIFSPHLMTPKVAMTIKCLIQHQPWNKEFTMHLNDLGEDYLEIQKAVNQELEIMDNNLKSYLPCCQFGTAQRCLLAARLFGDESELEFWEIALHYLRSEKTGPMSKSPSRSSIHSAMSRTDSTDLFIPPTPQTRDVNDLVTFDDNKSADSDASSEWKWVKDKPLETCHDLLCDSASFQKYQLDRIALHESKRATYEHTKKCAESLMLLGQTDRAVQLLLETEADNDNYYVDCLRACLVASIRSSGASQSTIKLVATNLIASGKLSEGVQLLCLIDKGLDACRYLQTYGAWNQAAWLAKATLNYHECAEVMRRWVDHLCSTSVNQKGKAILVLLSLGQFYKIVEMLYGMRHFDRATLFVEACMEFGLLEKNETTTPLVEAVFLEYARFMINMGNRIAAKHYCKLAGENGQQLEKEVDILFP
ncbi:WD repeat-containing protein 11-like isoform X2 [Lineus longissimus]|uniref:WD repeat-containing protein 11-like isoform X2 n=1 Tax=Lineus longissimus TaxID=88925 RepID=UPI00315D2C85